MAGWEVPVSVNIGPMRGHPAFPATVARLPAERAGAGPELALEVSEQTRPRRGSSRFFAQLAESGVRVSLDDFGTGFASLESLGGWPVDELKLDLSIVRPMAASASFRAIVRHHHRPGPPARSRVVAEGIESEAVSSELNALQCDIGQGFLLGRPMSAAAFTDWMRDPDGLAPRRSVPATRRPQPARAGRRPGGSAAGRAAARRRAPGGSCCGWRAHWRSRSRC